VFWKRITLLTLCAAWALAQDHSLRLHGRASDRPARLLALEQTEYHLRAGEIVAVNAPEETVDFVRTAKSCATRSGATSGEDFVIAIRVADDEVGLALIAASDVKPGEYTVSFSAESGTGDKRVMALHVTLDPTSPAAGPMVVAPTGSQSVIASTEALIEQGWVVPGAFSQPTRAPELETEVESKFILGDEPDLIAPGSGPINTR